MPETKNEPTFTADFGETTCIRDRHGGRVATMGWLRGRDGLGGRRDASEVEITTKLFAAAPETKRQRDALLVALKWAILHSFDVAECDCQSCVEVRAIVAECELSDAGEGA
jgi:hypothetical protein